MNSREYKNSAYSEIALITKAISNAHRLEIIDLLANGKKRVDEIARQTNITIANASQHLQVLKKERLVDTEKKGVQVFYKLANYKVYQSLACLRDLALSSSPFLGNVMEQNRNENNYWNPLTLEEYKEELRRGENHFFVDVRPKDEYEQGHIPNAISIPIHEFKERITELPKDKWIIAYCRGMFCSYADEAVKILTNNGYMAKKMDMNILDFKQLQ